MNRCKNETSRFLIKRENEAVLKLSHEPQELKDEKPYDDEQQKSYT